MEPILVNAVIALGSLWTIVGTLLKMTEYLNGVRDRILEKEKSLTSTHFQLLRLDWKLGCAFVVILCLVEAGVMGWLAWLQYQKHRSEVPSAWMVFAAIAVIPGFAAIFWTFGGWKDWVQLRRLRGPDQQPRHIDSSAH